MVGWLDKSKTLRTLAFKRLVEGMIDLCEDCLGLLDERRSQSKGDRGGIYAFPWTSIETAAMVQSPPSGGIQSHGVG